MKRRHFGLMATSGLAAAATLRPALAQAAPDPTLLTTTLTPLGAERAGNADGSIPAWTGGMTEPSTGPVAIEVFQDEQPLFTVDASNLAEHQDMVPVGIQWMIKNVGFSLPVYPTHRTSAAPQYVYDNTALTVSRTQLNPNGGRLGFTGGYGGIPFPIIDTSAAQVAGAQLIWNHLVSWQGFSSTSFAPGYVMTGGQLVLSEGGTSHFRRPYYDPEGSLETFDGYFYKLHLYFSAPANFDGQEVIQWHTVNQEANPDITWELLNGQGRVRKAPDEQYDSPNAYFNGVYNQDENNAFSGNPSQYDWTYIGKQEMYIPYHCNSLAFTKAEKLFGPKVPDPQSIRWEKHRCWIVEATLHPGIRNVMSKRRYYLDEDSWVIATGESYGGDGGLARIYMQFSRAMPTIPATAPIGFLVYDPVVLAYAYAGYLNVPPFTIPESLAVNPASMFIPQEMSANASF